MLSEVFTRTIYRVPDLVLVQNQLSLTIGGCIGPSTIATCFTIVADLRIPISIISSEAVDVSRRKRVSLASEVTDPILSTR